MNMKSAHLDSLFQHIADDTAGAIVGSAVGVGVSALAGLAMPTVETLVPWGLIAGSITGICVEEWRKGHARNHE